MKSRVKFNDKYLVDIGKAEKNKTYIVTAINVAALINRVESLLIENCYSIEKSVLSALSCGYTDRYPFTFSGASYIYDIEQQVRDENLISFKTKDHLELKEREEF